MTLDDLLARDRDEVRALIAHCTAAPLLEGWFRLAAAQVADIRDDIESFRFAGTAQEDWLRRAGVKLAILTRTRRYLETRLLELGEEVPWGPSDPRMRQIRRLENRIRRLSAALKDAGLEIPA